MRNVMRFIRRSSFLFLFAVIGNLVECVTVDVPNTVNAILGRDLSVECNVERNLVETIQRIEWQFKDNSRYLTLARADIPPEGEIKIDVITSDDNLREGFSINRDAVTSGENFQFLTRFRTVLCRIEGDYKCRIQYINDRNDSRTRTAETRVNVQAVPERPGITFNQTIIENSPVSFECGSVVGRPEGTFIWTLNSTKQLSSGTVIERTENECIIKKTERQTLIFSRDNGSVVLDCVIDQVLASPRDSFKATVGPFNVLYPPSQPNVTSDPTIEFPFLAGMEGLTLYCSADSNPDSSFEWMFNGELVGNGSTLVIPELMVSDDGNYTCSVRNIVGQSSTTVSVTVMEPTLEPEIEQVTGSLSTESTIALAVVMTMLLGILLVVVVVVLYRKGIIGGKFQKRTFKEMMPSMSKINHAINKTDDEKRNRDKTPLADFDIDPDNYVMPDEINMPVRSASTVSNVSDHYENAKSLDYENATGLRKKAKAEVSFKVDQHGYTMSRQISGTENFYDEIRRKNTVKFDNSDCNHDYMIPI